MSLKGQPSVRREAPASPQVAAEGTARRTPGELLADDRGVIMVAGVFFTLLMIGCVWFIFGIGNAIAYRERLQSAADASAFAAAVFDAQGMNLLAMVNIIMGLVALLLFVAKIVEIVKVFSDLGTCQTAIKALETCIESVICDVPVTLIPIAATALGVCTYECHDVESWQSKLQKFDKYEHMALAGLHDAEVGIAVIWPWIGAGESGNMEAFYKKGVPITTSFSYSQIPWSLESDVGSLLGNIQSPDAGGGKTKPPKGPTRYGLPVTSDTNQDLCRVMYYDVDTIGGLIPSNKVSQVLGDILQATSQWFCDDGAGSAASDPGSSLATAAIEGVPFIVDFEASAFCAVEDTLTNPKAVISFVSNPGKGLNMVGGALNAITPLPMSTNKLSTPSDDYSDMSANTFGGVKKDDITFSPMMMFGPAKMGLDYYGVWSTAIGNFGTDQHASRVAIAGLEAKSGSKVVAQPPQDVSVGVSKSEFYYDPGAGDTTKNESSVANGVTTDPTHDVLWNMRWRARLRRYHYFPGALGEGDQFLDLAGQGFTALMTKIGNGLEAGQSPSSILGDLYTPEVDVNSYKNKPSLNLYH